MPDSTYLAAIDLGHAQLKASLYQIFPDHYRLLAIHRLPRMRADQTAAELLTQLLGQASLAPDQLHQILLVGDTIGLDGFLSTQVTSYSQEEALAAILKRLSSTGTAALIDIGSHQTLIGTAEYGQVQTHIFPYGVGEEGWNFLRHHQQTESLRRWLPVQASADELENYVANKSIYPDCLPTTPRELAIEQALAKLILTQIITEQSLPWDHIQTLVVSGGVLAGPAHAPQTIAMILDGLQPTGIMQVSADPDGSLLSLGGFLAHQTNDDYRLGRTLLNQLLLPIGALISFQPDAKHPTKITLDTGLRTNQAVELQANDLLLVPLEELEEGTVSFAHPGKPPVNHQVTGGQVGLVIDGRHRPLQLGDKDNERFVQLISWDKQLNAHQQIAPLEPES